MRFRSRRRVSVWVLVPAVLFATARPAPTRPLRRGAAPAPTRTTNVKLDLDGPEMILEMQPATASSAAAAPAPTETATAAWTPACAAPCERPLPRSALFRLTGPGLVPSEPFNLPEDRDAVTVSARPGAAHWYWTGVVTAALGATFVIGGAGPPLVGGGSFSTTEKILTATGVTALLFGIPVWILNRTIVTLH